MKYSLSASLRRMANFHTFMPLKPSEVHKSSVASFTFIFATGTLLEVGFESAGRYE